MFDRRKFLQTSMSAALGIVGSNAARSRQKTDVVTRSLTLANALNRAGRLRGLSQRTVKGCAQAVLGVLPERAVEIVVASNKALEANVAALSTMQLKPQVMDQFAITRNEVEQLMLRSRSGRISRESLVEINRQADFVLQSADKLAALIEDSARSPTARFINIAGRQRLHSQRAAKAYFLLAVGLDSDAMTKAAALSRSGIEEGLRTLSITTVNNERIQFELMLAQSQWAFLGAALNRPYTLNGAQDVAKSSERIFEVMDSLTDSYEISLMEIVG